MNIYEKMQKIKEELAKSNLKKSGKNTYSNYSYYELADFLPKIITLCNESKLFTKISFNNDLASLEIINSENPEEIIIYESPMRDLDLKGCNEIQALGGVQTYSRRYLYMSAFDIVESDMFDRIGSKEKIRATNSEQRKEASIQAGVARCEVCGKEIKSTKTLKSHEVAEKTKSKMGKAACINCAKKWDENKKQAEKIQEDSNNE